MSNEENKQQIAAGLERRKEERALREAALEEQARQLRLTISGNHAEKTMSEIQLKAIITTIPLPAEAVLYFLGYK